MRQNREPGQTSGEKYDLAKEPAQGGASKGLGSMLRNISREPCNQRISQQKSARGAKQLSDASRTAGAKHWQAHRAFRQIKRHRRKPPPAAQHQSDQQR